MSVKEAVPRGRFGGVQYNKKQCLPAAKRSIAEMGSAAGACRPN